MKTLLAIVAVGGAGFLAGLLVGPRWPGAVATHTVRRVGDYPVAVAEVGEARGGGPAEGAAPVRLESIHALGRVEPSGGLYLVGAPAGARIDRILVEVGQEVREGQELAYVEGHAERKAQIDLIRAQLEEAREQLASEREYEAILDQEAALEKDELALLEGPEIRTQEANIEVLAEKANSSRKDYEHLVELNKDRRATVSAQQLERQHLVMRQDEAALRSARAELEKFRAARKTRLAKLEVQLRKGKSASRRTRHAIPLRSLEMQLQLAEQQARQAIIRAPRAGRVLAVLVKPGEVAGPKPVVQLGDTRRMYVVAEVDEEQVARVRKGQRARIESHSLGRPYTGVVESWALMVAKNDVLGLDPAAAAYARVVEIKVRVDEPCDELRDRTHMQVTVDIEIDRAAKARPAGPAAGSSS